MEDKKIYSRKSPRIPHYDYATENYYFVTICADKNRCIFGLPKDQTSLGRLVRQHIEKIHTHYACVHVDKYVVMPNHVHMILVIEESQKTNLNNIVGLLKSGITRDARKAIKNIQIWQRSYHDHVIRNQKQYEMIWTYIENNPLKWEEDCFYKASEEQEE